MKRKEQYLLEVKAVKKLIQQKYTVQDIAKKLGIGKDWVYRRLKHEKNPAVLIKEEIKNNNLAPYLIAKGHTIVRTQRIKLCSMWKYPSMISKVNNRFYIFEILPDIKTSSDILRALGAMRYYQMVLGINRVRYCLVIPNQYKHSVYFKENFLLKLKSMNMSILFI